MLWIWKNFQGFDISLLSNLEFLKGFHPGFLTMGYRTPIRRGNLITYNHKFNNFTHKVWSQAHPGATPPPTPTRNSVWGHYDKNWKAFSPLWLLVFLTGSFLPLTLFDSLGAMEVSSRSFGTKHEPRTLLSLHTLLSQRRYIVPPKARQLPCSTRSVGVPGINRGGVVVLMEQALFQQIVQKRPLSVSDSAAFVGVRLGWT